MSRAGLDTDAVVAAAAALADAEGLSAVTVSRVAAGLGVRPPSLYAHVGGLGDLRRRVGARGASELAAALSAAAAGRAGRDALGAVAEAYRSYARAHPGRYAAAQLASDLRGDAEGGAAGEAAVGVVLAVLRGYGLEGEDAVHSVRIIRSALHGFVTLEADGGFAIELSLEETFQRLLGMLDRGLGGVGSSACAGAEEGRGS